MITIGYPIGKFGPVSRVPVEEVVWKNQYGTPLQRPAGYVTPAPVGKEGKG
jgi:hypothetical protein